MRVLTLDGEMLGVLSRDDAIAKAREMGLDLIEISPNAKPPVAKIMDYGKFQYDQKKKAKAQKAGSKQVETKNFQVKLATGDHDLALKAKRASEWLKEGHRIKVDLFLVGRAKYMERDFLKKRLDRVLNLITEDFTVAEEAKKSPKGLTMVIEPARGKNK